jgi:hypothetical protein
LDGDGWWSLDLRLFCVVARRLQGSAFCGPQRLEIAALELRFAALLAVSTRLERTFV